MSTSKSNIPLRSPTPPLDSSSDELNELSLEQELARLERPHFLDYTHIGIPYPPNEQPPPIPPRHPLTTSLPSERNSSIPLKMTRSAETMPPSEMASTSKKHFLDENPIRPDYVYDRPSHSQFDKHFERDAMKSSDSRRSADKSKHRKSKEPNYMLSRFLETDDTLNEYRESEVKLSDINLIASEQNSQNVGAEYVYSLLSMIGCNPFEMSKKFLDLSKSPNTCATLRQSKCILVLVQMIHCEGGDNIIRQQAREALRNVVNYHPDDKVGRREVKVLRYVEQIMDYCDLFKRFRTNETDCRAALDTDNHPLQAMSSLMKISFDELHRHSMCTLGALQTIADLVRYDHAVHGTNPTEPKCIQLRRYAGMALTNLTFGDGNNKALLCGNREFMKALVAQINTEADDLLQVTANVLRNLSWRADNHMKTVLNEIGTVTALTVAAMKNKNENTLRAILSALWNLSAHCSKNKAEFCMVDGALLFLVEMLTYESPNKTLSIIENAGGILRNVSSHIAVNEDFRKILRQRNCLGILLQQLRSESLTIVSNACGTLWNLSARCAEDQQFLRDNGAVPMLKSLIHSKHKMISNGSKVALKNLIRPGEMNRSGLDPVAKMMGLKELPTLSARKQRALEDELDEHLSETCDETKTPPPLQTDQPSKSLNALETDKGYIEHFGHLSLQSDANQEKTTFWETKRDESEFEAPAVTNPTGTIPKRSVKTDENPSKKTSKDETPDSDQITNFSLLYTENHNEIRDLKVDKDRTFSVAEDTVKCYDNEGTPLLSTATSISDLRPLPKHTIALMRASKSGRTTNDNSGINTPEKPINYCEEGTPAYFSRRDSFSSLHEQVVFDIELTRKPQLNLPVNKMAQTQQPSQPIIEQLRVDRTESDSNNCTMPTTPGEGPSKTVTFNEFNLETPMMFSRHSSLGSLASHEPPLNDEIASVVSETSRMPSGIISPSEIPDSPSQTMPQSPRQKHSTYPPISSATTTNAHLLPVEDEVRTFGVENTPALISCATSLSNLSLDDEPKIANDLLIKEMRLMHQISVEQVEPGPSTNQPTIETKAVEAEAGQNSDSDESANDDSLLLENCISIGIQAKNIEPDIRSPPALPEPNDILAADSSSDDDENPDELIEQCIQSGIKKKSAQILHKENPIGMMRKGGNVLSETNYDEMNRFQMEDSPCNYSIASGLSDLTVGSNTIGLLKMNRLPSIQSHGNDDRKSNEKRSISPTSDDSEEDRILLNQAFAAGQAKIQSQLASNATTSQSSTSARQTIELNDSNSSISSDSSSNSDSNDSIALLQQCIQVGMGKAKPTIKLKTNQMTIDTNAKRSQLPTLKASTSQASSSHRSRSAKRYEDDNQLLAECINAGIERSIRSKSTVVHRMFNLPLVKSDVRSDVKSDVTKSKNSQATSATVQDTVGATDVVTNHRKGTVCEPDQHQMVVQLQKTPTMKNDLKNIHKIDNIIELPTTAAISSTSTPIKTQTQTQTATATATATAEIEIGFNNSLLNTSTQSTKSHYSFNLSGEIPLLERSNEYPANLEQNDYISDSQHSSSVDMEISNECLFENIASIKMDKHKDPNLMLQSVDRLTLELVSTAEYLRTTNSIYDDLTPTKTSSTWNDDTHSNSIQFPVLSKTAPIITDEDPTISDTNAIEFEIGGKVNSQINGDLDSMANIGFDSQSTTSTMTNSTIIAIEANKIRCQLMLDSNVNRTDSMISLDKIRPPSVMDKMIISSYSESLNGPTSLNNRSPAKLMAGFMARRALQTNASHGSQDSINSSYNLDRVKPPSIMDELLDSMISVDSIASEYLDNPAPQLNEEPSQYETAFSECDDMTMTLKCCTDLPLDTPCASDFSSAESTPKKSRRSLTPRRKRQLIKDRYQTYTISTGIQIANDDETIQVDLQSFGNNDSDTYSIVSSDDLSSIRGLTKNLPYLDEMNDFSINTNTYTKLPRGSILNSLQQIATINTNDDIYVDQMPNNENHESKSPRIVKPNVNDSIENLNAIQTNVESKAVRGKKKPTYVSPYSMSKLNKTAPKPTKIETTKTPSKPIDSKTKSFIQRSAESLKKIRPNFTSKLKIPAKQSPDKSLNRQKSNESAQSCETIIRQSTFIKDEPSEGEIPVIVSEPSSPKKTKATTSKIPFNRTMSLQTRNVTKANTNIEIPLQKNGSATGVKRILKGASSTSQISSLPRGSLSPKQQLDSPSTSKNIFNRWTQPAKKTPAPCNATKLPLKREPISTVKKPIKTTNVTHLMGKATKLTTNRTISTNGRTTKV